MQHNKSLDWLLNGIPIVHSKLKIIKEKAHGLKDSMKYMELQI
jgi:hypothetical protein